MLSLDSTPTLPAPKTVLKESEKASAPSVCRKMVVDGIFFVIRFSSSPTYANTSFTA